MKSSNRQWHEDIPLVASIAVFLLAYVMTGFCDLYEDDSMRPLAHFAILYGAFCFNLEFLDRWR